MFYRVQNVAPMPGYSLAVRFQNGHEKRYDVAPLFQVFPAFQSLRDVTGLFEQVKVDTGGYGVCWNDEIDLSCNELWENGKEL